MTCILSGKIGFMRKLVLHIASKDAHIDMGRKGKGLECYAAGIVKRNVYCSISDGSKTSFDPILHNTGAKRTFMESYIFL